MLPFYFDQNRIQPLLLPLVFGRFILIRKKRFRQTPACFQCFRDCTAVFTFRFAVINSMLFKRFFLFRKNLLRSMRRLFLFCGYLLQSRRRLFRRRAFAPLTCIIPLSIHLLSIQFLFVPTSEQLGNRIVSRVNIYLRSRIKLPLQCLQRGLCIAFPRFGCFFKTQPRRRGVLFGSVSFCKTYAQII